MSTVNFNVNSIQPSNGTWTSSVVTTTVERCTTHITSPDLAEYGDGVVASSCVRCGERIEITRMVGGVNLLQVMDLLCLLSQGSEEARSQLIQMAVDLRQEIDCLQAALELVREVFGEDL